MWFFVKKKSGPKNNLVQKVFDTIKGLRYFWSKNKQPFSFNIVLEGDDYAQINHGRVGGSMFQGGGNGAQINTGSVAHHMVQDYNSQVNKGHVGGNMHQGGGPVFSFSTNKQFNSGSVGGNMVQNQDYDGHFGREQESCKNSFGKIMRENEGWIVENDDGSSDMCTCKIGGKKSCEPM